MIINTVNEYDFIRAFEDQRPDNFSTLALSAMFDWLDDLSDQTETPMELDVVAICCEFSEYESLEELQGNYTDIESLDDLHDNTLVIELPGGGLVIQDF
jgi:hypothetical protein